MHIYIICKSSIKFLPKRIFAWAFVWIMLSAKWKIEDDSENGKEILLEEQVLSLLKIDKQMKIIADKEDNMTKDSSLGQHKSQIILIAAMARNHVIGYKNTIPWSIKGEQKIFKKHTLGHTVIMGRKTYESIGKPLQGRKNIVITKQKNYNPSPEIIIASDIPTAINITSNDEKVFIIGGADIYKQTIDIADYIYLTIINRDIEGDTLFPQINKNFALIFEETIQLSETIIFNIYKKIELY